MLIRFVPLATLVTCAVIGGAANAAEWYVIGPGGSDTNDGDEWAEGLLTIQEGLSRAGVGDQIWVKAGDYILNSTTDTYLLTEGAWLLGGFAGTETDRKDANPYENETILSGNLSGGGNAYHVVTAEELEAPGILGSFTRLDGFIIEGGDASGDTSGHPRQRGGGLIVYDNQTSGSFHLKVSRCLFRNNDGGNRGGAVAVLRQEETAVTHNLELTNCEFTGNTAINGGAVWNFGAKIQINNSLFVDNLATNQGGAIWTNGGDVQISNSVVVDNEATSESGAMRSELLALTWSAYNTIDESEPRPQGSGVRPCAHHAPMYSTR